MDPEKWEYKIIERLLIRDNSSFKEILKELGEDGWELVGPPTEIFGHLEYIFKKRLTGTR
jgi:hypothetical protein